jgi:hypothetical protein
MTRLEEAVWAAAYVHVMYALEVPMTRVDAHKRAADEADFVVLAMRRAVGYVGRLHHDQALEDEREKGR